MFLDAMVDKMMHIMGEKINEYEVHFVCQDIFAIKYKKKATIIASPFIILPFESSVIFDADPTETVTLFGGSPTPRHAQEELETYELSNFKTKKAKIIFKVDINSFYEFKIEPYDGNEPSESIEKLDVVDGRRVELISFARSTKIV
uniref:Uncharacterized protein n=1 Tax=Panagrolaimus sp. ES5 TaxID=591445 RepID=A0AC34GLX7_9BILA